jgi:hypothetical protein
MPAERIWLRLLTVATGLGLAGGALLAWATLALSNTDIGGPGWSLRGNGALIVEFAGGPALLAGGWVWLVRRRLGLALAAAVLTLLIEMVVGFAPIVFLAGPGPAASAPLLIGLLPAIVACLVGLALALPRTRGALLASALVCLGVVALTLGLPFLLFILAPLLLPLVLVMPTFVRYVRREHIPSLVALPVALVAGTIGAQRLVSPG